MSKVIVERGGAVRTVTVNRPEKRNALDAETIALLRQAFELAPAPEERVIVVRGNGPAFCAGLDLSAGLQAESGIQPMLRAIELSPLPAVGVVHGDAIAGGNELALHCDIVVASTAARFGMSVVQIGIAPDWFLIKKLVEVAGPVAAKEMLLLGDPLSARRMHDLGLIARLAEPADLESAAKVVIDRLAANAPLAWRALKSTIVRQLDAVDLVRHADVDALIDAARTSEDVKEGIAARFAKRAAKFRGV
jgi:enoyl-CoA hydratase/carnithine racemase